MVTPAGVPVMFRVRRRPDERPAAFNVAVAVTNKHKNSRQHRQVQLGAETRPVIISIGLLGVYTEEVKQKMPKVDYHDIPFTCRSREAVACISLPVATISFW